MWEPDAIARDLLHPRGIGFGDDSGEFHFAGREANDEQHMIPDQSFGRPEFHGEEIGGRQYLPVSFEKLFPRQPRFGAGARTFSIYGAARN